MEKNIKKIMKSPVATLGLRSTIADAKLLMKNKKIRHLAVIDGLKEFVGVISIGELNRAPEDGTLQDFMSPTLYLISEDTAIQDAALRMIEKKVSCLIVCDSKEIPVGIVTTTDLLWYLNYVLRKAPAENNFLKHLLNLQLLGDVAQELADMGI